MTWYGLVVMTVVFESIDSGSNPDTTFHVEVRHVFLNILAGCIIKHS